MAEEFVKEGGKVYSKVEVNADDKIAQLNERKATIVEELASIESQLAVLNGVK